MNPVFKSRTIHFNAWSIILLHATWPFLPEHFRQHPWSMSAVSAWFTCGNVILRFLTTEALAWRKNAEEKK